MTTTPTLTPTMAMVPLDLIEESTTNPRKRFDQASLQDLADSIAATGVHQPVLLRPLPGHRVPDTFGYRAPGAPLPVYELVVGARRFRASRIAKASHIPAMVRDLTDAEALEIQVVENLQREDVTPLEEAEGYDQLMRTGHYTADQVAAKVGKSRSYVYSKLKVLDLCHTARESLRAGTIDFSRALLIARIPTEELQLQALKYATAKDYNGDTPSQRACAEHIQRTFMLKLSGAPFNTDDAQLLAQAGACSQCPRRTGANPDLFADVKSADVCTFPPCYRKKEEAHGNALKAAALERGQTLIEGREARKIMPNSWSKPDGYVRLDDASDSPTGKPLRKVLAKVMEAKGIQPVLLANPHKPNEVMALLPQEQLTTLLAEAGQAEAAEKAAQAAQQCAEAAESDRAAKRKDQFQNAWRWAVLEEVWAEAKSAVESLYPFDPATAHQPGPDAPIVVALTMHTGLARFLARKQANGLNQDRCKRLNKLLGLDKVAPQATLLAHIDQHPDPVALLWLLEAEADVEYRHWASDTDKANAGLWLAAEAFAVDVETVKKSVRNELNAKWKAEDAPPPLTPAAQASGGRGESSGKAKKGKTPAARARADAPTLSADEASRGIAAAMQGLDDGQTPPTASPAEPDGSIQRATPESNDASPLAAPAHPQPVHASAPGDEAAPPADGSALLAAPDGAPGASGIDIGQQVRVLATATGTRQAPMVGLQGVVVRKVGPQAWDVQFPGKKHRPNVPQWVCFDVSELEVVA